MSMTELVQQVVRQDDEGDELQREYDEVGSAGIVS